MLVITLISMVVISFFAFLISFTLVCVLMHSSNNTAFRDITQTVLGSTSMAEVTIDLSQIRQFDFGNLNFTDDEIDCSICLESFENSNEVIQLQCSKFHIFHSECLIQLLNSSVIKKCPLCRQPL